MLTRKKIDGPLLSVCIPTHDGRARRLDAALCSVFAQLDAGLESQVEICVSDNGSHDETQEIIKRHRRAGRQIIYARSEHNQGFLANLLRVAELAQGEFCWFLASDDVADPEGIRRLTKRLDEHGDVTGATLRPTSYAADATTELGPWVPMLHPRRSEHRQVFVTYADVVGSCGLLTGLISALVVRRHLWIEAVDRLGAAELARWPYHPHSRIVLEMLRRHPRWLWEPDRILRVRTGEANSVLAGLGGDVATYHLRTTHEIEQLFAEAVGRRSPAYREVFRRSFWFGWHPLLVLSWKARGVPPHVDRELLVALTRWFWWLPEFWGTLFVILLVPSRLLPGRLLVRAASLARSFRALVV